MYSRIPTIAILILLLLTAAAPAPITETPAAAQVFLPMAAGPAYREIQRSLPQRGGDTLVVRGRVVSDTGEPQAGNRVQALAPGGHIAGEVLTGSDGSFVIARLSPASYRLSLLDSAGAPLDLAENSAALVKESEQQRPIFHELILMPSSAAPLGHSALGVDSPIPPGIHPLASSHQPQPDPNSIQATGQITGVVTASDTGLPLQYAYVTAYDVDGYYVDSASTDVNGLYALTDLETGDYYIFFEYYSGNYATEWYDNKPTQSSANPVHEVDGSVTPNINAALDPGAQITGQVTGADTSLPLASVGVYAIDENGDSYWSEYTDASGNYTISRLPGGSYPIQFYPSGSSSDYLPEYYDDKPSLATADPVSVSPGGLASGIDAVLTRGGKITGQVTAADGGMPLTDVSIQVYDSDGSYMDSTSTSATGMYTVTALVSGSYKIRFTPYTNGDAEDYIAEYYNNKPDLAGADLVNVAAPSTVSGIDAVLTHGGKITGRVTAQVGGVPIEDVNVRLYNSLDEYYKSTTTGPSGYYTITALASDTYSLEFDPLNGGVSAEYLGEYYNNKTSVDTADPITVTAPGQAGGINASLALGGRITGVVTAQDGGQGLPDVSVQVIDCYGFTISYATTDASGVYTSTALASGSYRVIFIPDDQGESRAYLDEFYNNKGSLGQANSVNVTAPNLTTGVNAALTKGGQISGQVTAADGGAPLMDVEIEIYNSDWDYFGYAQTNLTGVYTTTGLFSGDYRLYILPDRWGVSNEYAQEFFNDKNTLDAANPVHVTTGGMTGDIDVALARGGKVSGRVTASDGGAGLEDVFIDIYGSTNDFWTYDTPDGTGNYTVYGVPSGSYFVEFYPFDSDRDYAGEFYNDHHHGSDADVITVTAPAPMSGIDAVLVRGGKIQCNVKAQDTNTPLEDVYVAAYNSLGQFEASDWTDSQGDCELNGLLSDNYKVWFEETTIYSYNACIITGKHYVEEYYDNKPSYDTADPISVTPPGIVSGINAFLSVGVPPPPHGVGTVYLPVIVR